MLITTKIALRGRSGNFLQSYFSSGNNGYGQTAINNNSIFPNVFTGPTLPYTGVTQPDSWSKWSMRFNSIAAVKSNGTLWVAGMGTFGQLGLGDTGNADQMTQVFVETYVGSGVYKTDWIDVGVGTEHISALDSVGNIWCAGRNDIAAVIHNGTDTGNVLTFYNTSLTGAPYNDQAVNFKSFAVGHRFVYGIDDVGDVWSWGNNGQRQLGRASPPAVSNPTQDTHRRKIDPPGPWLKVFAGGYHGGALHSDGSLWMWGLYSSGQRGAGIVTQAPTIVPTIGGVAWVDAYMGENSTFLRNANGEVYAMGANGDGQLGIGNTTTPISTPTKLAGSWRLVSIDWAHAGGIKTDGTLWMWGSNAQGQLGLGNTTSQSSPQKIGTDTTWINVVTGIYSTTAIKTAPAA